jgi:hypothetical protein
MLLSAATSAILGAVISFGVSYYLIHPGEPGVPTPPRNARFVKIGRAYLLALGKAYAEAWNDGAKQLDQGTALSASLKSVGDSFAARRMALMDKVLTPELARIVPESTRDTDVTPAERAAMAAAWRGLALGLEH